VLAPFEAGSDGRGPRSLTRLVSSGIVSIAVLASHWPLSILRDGGVFWLFGVLTEGVVGGAWCLWRERSLRWRVWGLVVHAGLIALFVDAVLQAQFGD